MKKAVVEGKSNMLCWYKIENRNFTDLDRDEKYFRQSNLDIGQTLYFYQCDNSRQRFGLIEFCWYPCKLQNQLHAFKTSNFGPRRSCINNVC